MLLVSTSSNLPRRYILIFLPVLLLAFSYRIYINQQSEQLFGLSSSILWIYKPSGFWHSFAPILAVTAPSCAPPALTQNASATLLSTDEFEIADYLTMKSEDIECIHRYHSLFVDIVNFGPPKLDYNWGSEGIVIAVEPHRFPIMLVNLLMLRRTNSSLPVEVFLATPDDFDEHICDVILPGLNAKCLVLSTLLESSKDISQKKLLISNCPLKIMAILLSSFEDVLYLEADTLLLQSPEALLTSEPFISSHLVFWPDLLVPTFAPQLSDIAGLSSDVLLGSPTTTGGQLLISKRQHAHTLLLTAYYNTYSTFYRPILTQGRPIGSDDFFAAALVTNTTSYTVNQPPRALGLKFNSTTNATLQHDPTTDYECEVLDSSNCTPVPLFLNSDWASNAALNPFITQPSGRLWGSKGEGQVLGMDLEALVWSVVVEVGCEDRLLRGWRHQGVEVCDRLQKVYRQVLGREEENVQRGYL